jgi:hypothetical protein
MTKHTSRPVDDPERGLYHNEDGELLDHLGRPASATCSRSLQAVVITGGHEWGAVVVFVGGLLLFAVFACLLTILVS